MKWTLIVLGVIVGLVAIVFITGLILPQGHTAVVTLQTSKPPEVVWASASDFAAWPSWNKATLRMERLADVNGHPTWRMTDSEASITSEVVVATPPAGGVPGRLETVILPGEDFGGRWIWEIAPAPGGGTLVTLTEAGEIYNPVFRFFARVWFGYTGTAVGVLRALGASYGESAAPVVVRER